MSAAPGHIPVTLDFGAMHFEGYANKDVNCSFSFFLMWPAKMLALFIHLNKTVFSNHAYTYHQIDSTIVCLLLGFPSSLN